MNCSTKKEIKGNRGFTLIELLTVIAIIGVLAGLVIPMASRALDSAKRSVAANNLRQIALATTLDATQGGGSFRGRDLHDYAAQLAKRVDLNDPGLWYVKEDPKVQASGARRPDSVILPGAGMDPGFREYPLSFVMVTNIPTNAPASTTPLGWTRGLLRTGSWDEQEGVYGSKGGYIMFLDGHVVWFTDLAEDEGRLVEYSTRKPTEDVVKAMSMGSRAIGDQGVVFSR